MQQGNVGWNKWVTGEVGTSDVECMISKMKLIVTWMRGVIGEIGQVNECIRKAMNLENTIKYIENVMSASMRPVINNKAGLFFINDKARLFCVLLGKYDHVLDEITFKLLYWHRLQNIYQNLHMSSKFIYGNSETDLKNLEVIERYVKMLESVRSQLANNRLEFVCKGIPNLNERKYVNSGEYNHY